LWLIAAMQIGLPVPFFAQMLAVLSLELFLQTIINVTWKVLWGLFVTWKVLWGLFVTWKVLCGLFVTWKVLCGLFVT
jgi:hypothetical protein